MEAAGTMTEDVAGVELSHRAMSTYSIGEAAKFLATSSEEAGINVALIVSQTPVERDKVVFGEFMMVKTKANLEANPRVASLVITQKLEMAGFKGEVVGWTDHGPYIDMVNNIDFFRYNAYAGIHNLAVAKVTRETDPPLKLSYAKVAAEFLGLRCSGARGKGEPLGGATIPLPIRKKFNGIMSVKVLAFDDADGYPGIVPLFGVAFRSPGELRFKVSPYNQDVKKVGLPSKVALNVLTLDLLTYQVKGELDRFEKSLGVEVGVVRMEEAYSSMPPLVGERIV